MKRFVIGLMWAVVGSVLLAAPITLNKIGIKNHELRLNFSSWIDSDNIHQMSLSHPPREVIDIKNARLKNRKNLSSLRAPGVRSFRIAQRNKNTIRIVIETEKHYKCKGYQPVVPRTMYKIPLPKSGSSEAVSKKRTDTKKSASSRASKRVTKSPVVKKAPAARKKKAITAKKRKPKRESVHEEKSSFFSSIFSSGTIHPKGSYTIVVDAGHGGHDSGAIGGGKYEKVLVLQVAKRVEKELKKRGYRVKMTRSSDHFVKLKSRTHFANRKKADIFVSIHANAIANKKRFGAVYGLETYFLQTTRSAKSKRIAAIENSVVLDRNDYLSNDVILQSVLSGPKIELSHKLAIDVQRMVLGDLKRKYRGVKDGGVKPAPFWVLVGAQMPSILVEIGYITNPIERRRLFSADYQKRIAKGIADGISNYLILREKEMN